MACRYLHEAIDVIADHCPDLVETLHRLQEAGELFVCLDGPLVPAPCTPRSRGGGLTCGTRASTIATEPASRCSPVTRASPHESVLLSRARPMTSLLPGPTCFLLCARPPGLPTLADKGCTGAGTGIKAPVRGGPGPNGGTRWRSCLTTSLRAPAERVSALLKSCKALGYVALSPTRITATAQAALVLLELKHNHR